MTKVRPFSLTSPRALSLPLDGEFPNPISSARTKVDAYFESHYFLDLPRVRGSVEVRNHTANQPIFGCRPSERFDSHYSL